MKNCFIEKIRLRLHLRLLEAMKDKQTRQQPVVAAQSAEACGQAWIEAPSGYIAGALPVLPTRESREL